MTRTVVPVARSIYITGLEPGGGKSTVALGVAEVLSRRVRRLAVFRPLVRQSGDPIVELLRDRYQAEATGYGTTYADAATLVTAGDPERLVEHILERYRALTADAEAVIVVGTDFGRDSGESGVHEELAFNARLAIEFGAVVLPVVDGHGRATEAVAGAVRAAYHSLTELGTTVAAVFANRLVAADRDAAISAVGTLPVPVYGIPAAPAISAPTLAEAAEALGAERVLGDERAYDRDVLHFVVGAAQVPVFLDHLADGCAVITPGDRSDLVTATFAAHAAGFASVAGIVLTLGVRPDPRVLDLVEIGRASCRERV